MQHRPNVEGWYRLEGKAYVRINADGLRDKEHSREKPPGTLRIAVLGDSFAEALQVPVPETFWAILERNLRGCRGFAGRPVEVINFGVSDYGTAQQFLLLRHRVWQYAPDLVIVALFLENDVRNNSKMLERDKVRPFFVLHDGELSLDTSFRENSLYKARTGFTRRAIVTVSDHLRVIQLANLARRRVVAWSRGAVPTEDSGVDEGVFRPPAAPEWQQAWRVTEALLLKMRDEVRAHGARLLLVTLSSGIQVDPDPVVRRRFMEKLGIDDLFYSDRRVRRFAIDAGIEIVTLAPPMQAYAESNQRYLHGFANTGRGRGHWNTVGHAVAAENIREYLCGGGISHRQARHGGGS
jgi:hypothetical protein